MNEFKEGLQDTANGDNRSDDNDEIDNTDSDLTRTMENINYNIITGPPIQDRKSTFQAHFCEVKAQNDVK